MERRKFIKKSCAIIVLGVVGPSLFLESCAKGGVSPSAPTVNFKIDLTSSKYQSLNTVGNYIYNNNVIIVNTTQGFIALSKICTHQGCTVAYNKNANDFQCPCHGAVYNDSGKVMGGPAPAPLKKYTVVKNGNTLTITG